jgi:ABC-type arginine transport system permease subunit
MPTRPTIVRFIEAFVAVLLVAFGASAVFSNGTDLFGADGLHAIAEAAVAAALLAIRRVLAVNQ